MINKIKKYILEKTNLIMVLSIPFYIFRLFKIQNEKIFIMNYNGKGYGDNAKYIVNKLLKNGRYKIYWAVKNNKEKLSLPKGILPVKMLSIGYFYHLSTSKIWINNARFGSYVRKRRDQFYIQTWHSSLRLKKIELDAREKLSKSYLKSIYNDNKMIDLLISGSKLSSKIYKRAFSYEGEIFECGTPRCDIFFNEKIKNKIKDKVYRLLKLNNKKKIILYAPTFRNNKEDKSWLIDFKKLNLDIFKKYNILIRLHPNNKKSLNIDDDRIVNVTDYPDMQELLIASDILITDYSGCCFDMLINNKRCILYVKDFELYLKNDRDLYFNIEDLPFEKAFNELELGNFILEKNASNYKYKDFCKAIGLAERGDSAIKIAKKIEEIIKQ